LAVHLSLSRPLFASDLSPCLGGDLPILMEGDSNAKHVEDLCMTIPPKIPYI
jgi:hypothetical protein